MQQTDTIHFKVTLTVKTGLHIGGSSTLVQIGGIDNPIIKDHDGYPYVPGSSLKGKLRSLYELKTGKVGPNGSVHKFCNHIDCEICRFFGISGDMTSDKEKMSGNIIKGEGNGEGTTTPTVALGPTRFLFRDLTLARDLTDKYKFGYDRFKDMRTQGINPLEEKMEVAINRNTGTVSHRGGGPRPLERVPAGTIFTGDLAVRTFGMEAATKKDRELMEEKFGKDLVKLATLLQQDYLGGMGSRGSGQVEIIFSEILVA